MKKQWISAFLMLSIFLATGCSGIRTIQDTLKTVKAGEMPSVAFRQEIPFTYLKNLIVVEARLNDEEKVRKFVLDTGAILSIKKSALPSSGIQKIGALPVASANSQIGYLDAMMLDKITFGEVEVTDIGLAVVDDDSMEAQNPVLACFFEEVDGLIGSNVMRYARWEIDHERQIITITDDSEAFPPSPESIVIPFKNTIQGVPLLSANINEGHKARFIVDTGSGGYFQFNDQLLTALEKDKVLKKTEMFGETASGIFGADKGKTQMVKIDSLNLPGIKLKNIIAGSIKSRFNLLGNAFMIHYKTVFDWEKETITFTPIDPAYYPPQQVNSFGLGYAYSDSLKGLYVSSLFTEGDAAKKYGLELDMPIHQLAGKSTWQIRHTDYCEMLMGTTLDSMTTMYITVMQGDSLRSLELEKQPFFEED